jgi:hypothetical protein
MRTSDEQRHPHQWQRQEPGSVTFAWTNVPSAVGDVAGFVVGAAIRPNGMLALTIGLGVVGMLIGSKIIGPRNNATHLCIVMCTIQDSVAPSMLARPNRLPSSFVPARVR